MCVCFERLYSTNAEMLPNAEFLTQNLAWLLMSLSIYKVSFSFIRLYVMVVIYTYSVKREFLLAHPFQKGLSNARPLATDDAVHNGISGIVILNDHMLS